MESIHSLTARRQILLDEIQKRREFLETAPEGILFSRKQKDDTYRYFHSIPTEGGIKEVYLKNDEKPIARLLARKMVAQRELEDLEAELRIIEKMFQRRCSDQKAAEFLKRHPGIAELLHENPNPVSLLSDNWKQQPYIRNQNHPESLIYPTVVPGLKVRSKSEADIISRMEYFGVPYHYDEVMTLSSKEIAIDFRCLNVRTQAVWYWDHRGMLDTPDYIKKTLYCESLFLNNGIIPWINMIVTCETRQHPLDLQWVDHLIQYYLL